MNRRRFALAAAAALSLPAWASREPYARGVLWRVTQRGAAPSHVFGTIHDTDARLAELPAAIGTALEGSKRVMVEFLPDGYSQERFLEAAMFADRQTLEPLIGAADFARVLEQLAPIGLERDVVNRLKPWGVLLNLRTAERPGAATVDAQIVDRARARRMTIAQIEGVEEQIFTFDECPLDSQIALLRHSLAHRAELVELAGQTVSAYLARDLAAIWRLREDHIARYPQVAPHQAIMTKRVLYDRSVVMAYRMQRELRRGNAFVALGALHLYGSRGVLALLQADGYRAVRVY
jgi:uncharacterized protein YbaP (TraB family)